MAPLRKPKMTDYERRRLENIKKNAEMLAALKIPAKIDLLAAVSKRPSVETKLYKDQPEKRLKPSSPVVMRRSLRTRGEQPAFKGLGDNFDESEGKIIVSPSIPDSPSPVRVLGPLKISDASVGAAPGFTENFLRLKSFLTVASNQGCQDDNDFCESGEVEWESKGSSTLQVDSFSLRSENVARIMPGRITAVRFFPSTELRMIVAGNKYGDVGFWHVNCEDGDNGIFLYHPHNDPTSGVVIQQSSMSKIITSCYGGLVRMMDAEKEMFDLVYSSDEPIFSLSQQPSDAMGLYFGEGRGGLNIWDLRSGKSSARWDLHADRINTVDFNPLNPFIMATSSTDATASIWDLRKMNAGKRETLKTVEHKRAVHSAYFSPSGSCLATTSIDDHVGITKGFNFEDTSMIYHYNQTGRWLSSFRAIWGWDDSYLFIGNMKRGVDLISTRDKTVVTLESELMSAIPCRIAAHPSQIGMLAATTSGGQVYMWTANTGRQSGTS